MAGPVRIAVLANGSQAKREFNSVASEGQSKLGRLGSVAKGAGLRVAGGLALAGFAAAKFGVAAVKSASDAQQSMGATETVFGRYASKIVANSDRAAQSVGLSANQYRESANLIGSLFRNQGVAADKLAGKTDAMVKTGADLAATYGGTTKDAVEALGSAFKGEFDPLEKYGISIKQSTINAELAKRGQDKLTGSALAQAKQVATTALITKQAGGALGSFGRESNTLAGQQQRLGASWDNLKSKAGAVLLPALTKLAGFANSTLVPALQRLGPPVVAFAQQAGQFLAPILARIASAARAVAPFIVRVASAIAGAVPVVIRFAQGIATRLQPVVRALIDVFQNRVLPTFNRVRPQLVQIAGQVGRAAAKFFTLAATVAGKVLPPLIRFAGFMFSRVVPAAVRVVGAVVKVVGALVRFQLAVARVIVKIVLFAVTVGRKIGEVIGFFVRLPGRILGAVGRLGGLLVNAGRSLIGGFINGIVEKFNSVRSTLGSLTSKLTSWKGPPKRDAKLLTPAGELIIQGLVDGFDRRTPAVRKALGTLSREISTFDATPTASVRLSATQAYAQQNAARANGTTRHVFTAEQVSAIQRGREVALDLRAYQRAGGKLP